MGNNDASADQSVELKKSARRRLVGAIALALFVVIVLPMVMEREPKSPSQDIRVRIPSQESITPMPNVPAGPVRPDLHAASPVSGEQLRQPMTTTATPREEAGNAAQQPAPALAQSKVESLSAEAPKSGVDHAAATKAEEVRAAAALTGNAGQWLVRLGAYQNAANVRVLLAKVKEMGVPAYSEKFDSPGGTRTRVFAGPFASRDAADKAQARVKKIGVDGTVMAKP